MTVKIVCEVTEYSGNTVEKFNLLADALDEFFDGKCEDFKILR